MTSHITCHICHARPAELTIVRRHGDDEVRSLVCRECGQVRARLYVSSELNLGDIINRIGSKKTCDTCETCPLCGASEAEIISDGRPGCCFCYGHFDNAISELVRSAQGYTRHVGKTPS